MTLPFQVARAMRFPFRTQVPPPSAFPRPATAIEYDTSRIGSACEGRHLAESPARYLLCRVDRVDMDALAALVHGALHHHLAAVHVALHGIRVVDLEDGFVLGRDEDRLRAATDAL